jgi:hypothetical protein
MEANAQSKKCENPEKYAISGVCKNNDYPQGDSKQSPQPVAGASGYVNSTIAGGAKSGALEPESGAHEGELGQIIAAWPRLPEAMRSAILWLVGIAGNRRST